MGRRLLSAGLAAAMVLAASAQAQPAARPWMDPKLSPDERARLLEQQMTLDERISVVHGPMAMPFGRDAPMPAGAIGSAGVIRGVQRLGMPDLQESDASLGVTNPLEVRKADGGTPLPSGLAMAASFDPQLAYEAGAMVGREAWSKGFNVLLGGGVNLTREPRNGRNFEYLGEDPLLAGTMAGEAVRGTQDQHVVSTLKHYALNSQETLRHSLDVRISQAAMRESDLLAFQIAIERGAPGSIMCSYNRVNGAHACDSDQLLNRILKGDWGYRGWVMSDWGAVPGVQAALHGLDQQSGEQIDKQVWFGEPLKQAVRSGEVPPARLSDMVRRILRSMFAVGLFEHPPQRGAPIDREADAAVARRAAEAGIVLLKNDGAVLPVAKEARRIVVIGGHADAGVLSGGGSSQVIPPEGPAIRVPVAGEAGDLPGGWRNMVFHPSSPLKALRAALPGAQVTFVPGDYPRAAAAAARGADLAIVFATQWTTEGEDVPDLSLPDGQDQLIEAVAAANPRTVVVLETGGPVLMPWIARVPAVLEAWYPGARGGEAIARILTGAVSPSGRLPITFPADEQRLGAIPGAGLPPGSPAEADYRAVGSDVGYRWYAREGVRPLFAFGHGLSYTRFGYEGLQVRGGRTLQASFEVANTGARAGAEVAQVYLVSAAGRPVRRLIGFSRVELKPGERRRVTVEADPRLLGRYEEAAHGWRVDGGLYRVEVGGASDGPALSGVARVRAARLAP